MKSIVRSFAQLSKGLWGAFSQEKMFGALSLLIAGYIAAGMLFYAWADQIPWLDAFYYCTLMIADLGPGGYQPKTAVSKLFTAVYSILGTGLFLGLVSGLAQAVLHKQDIKNHSD